MARRLLRSAERPGPGAAAPPDDRLLGGFLLVFAAVAVIYALRSTGAYHDDDLDHFYMARAALRHPAFLIDPWGRPAFTILYAIPAQLGFLAVRLTTVVVAVLAAAVTARAATRLKFAFPPAAAGLAAWQSLFFLLSFSSLVEPLAALLVAVVLEAVAAGRPRRAAVAAGLLPLARLELVVAVPLVAAWLVRRRAWRELVWLAIPLAAWAVAGAIAHADPLWLPHVVRGTERPLATAGPIHYLRNYIVVVGPTVFLGLFLGFAALVTPGEGPRPKFAAGMWLLVFGALTALTWDKLHLGGSIGFLRHLIVLAPAAALVAAAGFEALARPMAPARRAAFAGIAVGVALLVAALLSHRLEADYYVRPGHDWSRLIGLAPAVLLALVAVARPAAAGSPVPVAGTRRVGLIVVAASALFCVAVLRPIGLNVEQKTVKAAVDFLEEDGYISRPLLANHPWFYFLTGRDRWDRRATPYVTKANLDRAAPGSVVVWENHYGQRLYGDVPYEALERDPRYRMIFGVESGDRQFRVVLFERIG